MNLDVLVAGAHPDDADLGLGALLYKLGQRGFRTGILDLSRGESSSRGTVEERKVEAANAGGVLGLTVRENAELPDGAIANVKDQQETILHLIRKLRPKILYIPMKPDRHPDHAAAHDLLRDANFFAGLSRVETDEAPHRAEAVYTYYAYTETDHVPQFVFDVSDSFNTKLEALKQYKSQFYNPDYPGSGTLVASKAFWENIEIRAAYWGSRIGARFGEPVFGAGPAGLDLPLEFMKH